MNSIFQTKEWEQFKLQTGYQKSYWLDDILVLQKDIALGRTMLYSPLVNEAQVESRKSKVESEKFIEQIKKIAKENNSIFYRLELDIPATTDGQLPTGDEGIVRLAQDDKNRNIFVKSFEEMQPEHTLVLDLTKSEDDILAQMKQKGRYNIKQSEKHNVTVKKTRDIESFYKLYKLTAERQKISFRNQTYFQKLIDLLEPKGYCEVFEASAPINVDETTRPDADHKNQDRNSKRNTSTDNLQPTTNQVLATAIVTFYKGRATYMFGSSSREMRNVMAPYGLHFEIIKDAKSRGCREYDFFGVAPENEPNHPWAGVTAFKEKFGGERKELLGSYDMILKPFEYKIFKMAEKIRR